MSEIFMRYLEERLCQWADWYTSGNCYGLGYPGCSVEYRILLEGGIQHNSGPKPLPSNEAAEEIENLVKQMALHNATMAKALRCHYFVTGSLRMKSSHLQISRTHFKHYVDMGHQWLAGRLSNHKRNISG